MQRTQSSLFHVLSFRSCYISPVSPASDLLGNWLNITAVRITHDRLFNIHEISNYIARERIRIYEESDTVIDD
jgi:hypothetical protein